MRIIIPILLLGAFGLPALAQSAPLPDDVAAIVKDEIVTMAEFKKLLVSRFKETEEGRKALETYLDRIIVDEERRRRGLRIADEDVRAFVKKVELDVIRASDGAQTLESFLKEKGTDMEEFLQEAKDYLARQRMASDDLEEQGELSLEKIKIWSEGLKRQRGVSVGGAGRPEGVYARIGDRDVKGDEFGEALLSSLRPARLESALWDLVISRMTRKELAAENVVVEPKDIKRAMDDLRAEFHSDPRFRRTGFTFEQYVQTVRKMSLEELERDPLFPAHEKRPI